MLSFPPPSAEDSESPLDWLPMAPEIEDPEEPGWGQLEVSGRGQQDVVVGGASGRGQLDVVVGGASGGVSWMLGEGSAGDWWEGSAASDSVG